MLSCWLRGFSQIFLQSNAPFGLLCLAAIGAGAPSLLPGALLGASAGPLLARLLRAEPADIDAGFYGYNAVLLGLLLPCHFAWSPALALLILAASLASVALQRLLLRLARARRGLPPYTLAFILLGWALPPLGELLQLAPATPATAAALAGAQPDLLGASLRAFGQVMFLDAPLAGALLWFGLLLGSPRVACWALFGAVVALPVALLAGLPPAPLYSGLLGMNSALAALALAQRQPAPCWPALGSALALLLQLGFAAAGLPALTAPFVLACLLLIASERLLRPLPLRAAV
ncbi:urea transporter [Pseudomonas panipatensis]|uniref:Urea transporter n=2 Tax=Pseudomonas panipatensis TaxID=428992 RepID=A0A1G8G6A0_9PSED|nr:urea transporter [Pseudomonas panipatensis]SMP45178.1 urea transporter [Pseudomonas panipatensis]